MVRFFWAQSRKSPSPRVDDRRPRKLAISHCEVKPCKASERFQAKRVPVRVKKTRKNKKLESQSDSIGLARPLEFQRLGLLDPRKCENLSENNVRRLPVDPDQCDGRSAFRVAAQCESRDIDPRIAEQAGETADESRLVLVGHINHRGRKFGIDLDALDLDNARLAVVEYRSGDGTGLFFRFDRQSDQ